MHSDERPFHCDICGKSFKTSACLKLHQNTHGQSEGSHDFGRIDIKLYECKVCKKTFNKYGNRARHMKIHTDDKKHECNICRRRFMYPSELTKHRRVHTGERPYKCVICDMA